MSQFDFSSYIASVLPLSTNVYKVEALTGGYTNLTARATFNAPISFQSRTLNSVILKYAPPHFALDPTQTLSVRRQFVEARALEIVNGTEPRYTDISTVLRSFDRINVPELILFDDKSRVLWISDLGNMKALQDYVLTDDGNIGQLEAIASDLGKLHASLFEDTGIPPDDVKKIIVSEEVESDTAQYLSRLAKEAMLSRQIPDALQLSERILHAMSQSYDEDNRFGMWDFWPGSVLVGDTGNVALIDWEYFCISSASTELGMFIAHLHLHILNAATPAGGSKRVEIFVNSMLAAYRNRLKETPSRSFQRRLLMACGRELVNGVEFYALRFKDEVSKRRVVEMGAISLRAAGASEAETDLSLLAAEHHDLPIDILTAINGAFSILFR